MSAVSDQVDSHAEVAFRSITSLILKRKVVPRDASIHLKRTIKPTVILLLRTASFISV